MLLCAAAVLGTCARPPTVLDEIHAVGELRVVTRDGPNTYFTSGDGPSGPEYELLQGFAEYLGVPLRLIVVRRAADVLPAVVSGKAHLAAAGLTVNSETERVVDFGPVYQQVTEHLVYRDGRRRPQTVRHLHGKRLEVASGTSYVKTLARTQALHPDLVWTENPHANQTELLNRVAEGTLDYTVVKSNAFAIYRSFIPEIRVAFNLAEGESVAWAFAKRNDASLKREAERYFAKIRANGRLDQVLDYYYGHMPRIDYVGTRRFTRDVMRQLPAYQKQFAAAAERYSIDWRLLAAIGYQESKWDPDAVSPTGVRGLMMLTEQTAQTFGIEDRTDPHQSIRGGARYFAYLLRQLPKQIREPDRTWFALAAYNIGYGHMLDARRLTQSRGGNPDLWADVRPNVKLLAVPEFYEKTRHGFARGGETVHFVDNVRTYYNVLTWLTKDTGSTPGWMQQRTVPQAIQANSGESRYRKHFLADRRS